ncbi:hypothetical protein GCM10010149_89110 [Nonomuraea roseoviolacea subsp. roseoviolacea]
MAKSRSKYANIPVKYQGLGFAAWKPYNERSEAALTAVQGFLDTFPQRCVSEPPEGSRALVGQGIAFVGSPGAGKTTLACITGTEVLNRHDRSIFFISYADYIAALVKQNSLGRLIDKGDQKAMDLYWAIESMAQKVINYPFVVFDDVGKEHHTRSGFAEDEFDRVLRARFRNGRPSGLSSNIPFEEWGKIYNPSMESFVREAFVEVAMGGKDLRR